MTSFGATTFGATTSGATTVGATTSGATTSGATTVGATTVAAATPGRDARAWQRGLPALLVALVAVLAVLAPGRADAHVINESHLYLDVTDRAIGGRVELPLLDVKRALDIDLLLDLASRPDRLADATPALQAYAADHLRIGADGETWPIRFTSVELPDADETSQAENAVKVLFEVDHDFDVVPRTLTVTFDPFFDEIDNSTALLLVGNDIQAGVFDNVDDVLVRFAADGRTHDVALDGTSWAKNLSASVGLGVDHIRTGPDHVLFVLVLLLPSVLVFGASGWRPAVSFGASLWRVLKTATMFTLAHTITFSLAGLDILPLPPSKFVESVIAISIAAAALHNLHPIARNKEWAIAFGFGLFHGMGFASLVQGLETSRPTQLISLLGRNIGIEIGQAVVILLIFPMLFLLRRTRLYSPIFWAASVLFAVVSLGWLVERAFERDLGISGFVEPLFDLHAAIVPIIVLTLAAAGWNRYESSRGALLPLEGRTTRLTLVPTAEPEPELQPVGTAD